MTSNLTLITTIVLTAAMTAAGTYYVATNQQPDQKPVAEATTPPSAHQPTQVAVAGNQQSNKPVEISIKTEVVEKSSNGRYQDHLAEWKALHSRPQPHYEVLK
jgi:hypothetical protein